MHTVLHMDTDNQLGTVTVPGYYTIPQAAARLATDCMTIMRLADAGTLTDTHIGRRRYVSAADVNAQRAAS